jgi:hypothetical protein
VGQWRRGNLTLTACNGTPSNNPFERKRQTYERSHLELNRSPAVHEAWGREEILKRCWLSTLDSHITGRSPGKLSAISHSCHSHDPPGQGVATILDREDL